MRETRADLGTSATESAQAQVARGTPTWDDGGASGDDTNPQIQANKAMAVNVIPSDAPAASAAHDDDDDDGDDNSGGDGGGDDDDDDDVADDSHSNHQSSSNAPQVSILHTENITPIEPESLPKFKSIFDGGLPPTSTVHAANDHRFSTRQQQQQQQREHAQPRSLFDSSPAPARALGGSSSAAQSSSLFFGSSADNGAASPFSHNEKEKLMAARAERDMQMWKQMTTDIPTR